MDVFFIIGLAAEVLSINYDFGRDIKVSIVCESVSAMNNTISMASNR